MTIFRCPPCGCETPHNLFDKRYSETFNRSFKVFECNNCGTKRLDPFLNEREIRDYYINEEIVGEGLYKKWRKKYRYIHNWLSKCICLRGLNILEIGSNSGNLLRYFKEKSKCEVLGVELSKRCKEYSENVNHVPVFSGTLEEYISHTHNNKKVDLILMVHTFEHLTDPDYFLNKLQSIIKEDGYLYLEIPNSRAIAIYLLKDIENVMCIPFHPYFYNIESLTSLLKRYNFKVIKKRYWSRKEDSGGLTKSLATYCRYKIKCFFKNRMLGKFLAVVVKSIIRFYPNRHLIGNYLAFKNKAGSIAVFAQKVKSTPAVYK